MASAQSLNCDFSRSLVKTYLMFLLYLLLFSLCYGIPSYIYFSKRKDMLIKSNMISKEELKEIINKNKRYKK